MKNSLIVINSDKEKSKLLAEQIATYLQKKEIKSSFYTFNGFVEQVSFEGYDFVITLGGDGTVLFAARNCAKLKIPVFPINLGEFGFIAAVQPDEWETSLEEFLQNNSPFVERTMMKLSVQKKNEVVELYGLNDVVISAKETARTISLCVEYNNNPLCKIKSDGLIFCTPTGSTAYSAAAGGPIIDPELDAFVMTPINAFSLSSRPIVLNSEREIKVKVEPSRTKEICLTVDGQKLIDLCEGDVIKISRYEQKVKLICVTHKTFINALRSKLNWSGVPHA